MKHPNLEYAKQCFLYSNFALPERDREQWRTNMWFHLLWAAELGELR